MKLKTIMCVLTLALVVLTSTISLAAADTNNTTENPVPSYEEVTTPTTTSADASTEDKFRVGPKVSFRPVEDIVYLYDDGTSSDGIVELFMSNPTLNDVTLTVDAYVDVPSSIHITGEGFANAVGAGTTYGTFTVPPGSSRNIEVFIKGSKEGKFTLHFSGLYYPDGNKDMFQQLSLTYPIVVIQKSGSIPDEIVESVEPVDEEEDDKTAIVNLPWDKIIILVAILGLIGRKAYITITEKD